MRAVTFLGPLTKGPWQPVYWSDNDDDREIWRSPGGEMLLFQVDDSNDIQRAWQFGADGPDEVSLGYVAELLGPQIRHY